MSIINIIRITIVNVRACKKQQNTLAVGDTQSAVRLADERQIGEASLGGGALDWQKSPGGKRIKVSRQSYFYEIFISHKQLSQYYEYL